MELTERLRSWALSHESCPPSLLEDAADEIDALRAEVAEERSLRMRLIEAVERSYGIRGPN